MGHREFLWVNGELLINWKTWKWWQKQQLTFLRRQLILRVKALFVEKFEYKIFVWDSEGGIPRVLSSVKSQSGITGRFAPFYSVWNVLMYHAIPPETRSKSSSDAETPLGRDQDGNHERHNELCCRGAEQQNRGHQAFRLRLQKQEQLQDGTPFSLRKTGYDAGVRSLNPTEKSSVFLSASALFPLDKPQIISYIINKTSSNPQKSLKHQVSL